MVDILDEDVDLFDSLDTEMPYHCETNLGAIDHDGHLLHEIIDGDEPLRPFIDFDLLQKMLDAINPKLTRNNVANNLYQAFSETCKEVFPKWDKNTLMFTNSSDAKKMSLHVATFRMRLKNISQIAVFTELVCRKLPEELQSKTIIDNITNKRSFSLRMLRSPKYNEETKKHVRVKKGIFPKDGTVYDFMLRTPNDKSRIIDSPLLVVLEIKTASHDSGNNEITQAEFAELEKLLKENNIDGYNLSYPSDNKPDIFPLTCISPSHYPLCDQDHNRRKYYRAKVYKAIQATVAFIQEGSKLWIFKHRSAEDGHYFEMVAKLDLEDFMIKIHELGGETVKIKLLIRQSATMGLIKYDEINFLPYSSNVVPPKNEFFNLFLGFLAKPATEINRDIIEPILWHVKNVICSGDERLNEYIWNWWAFLVQKPNNKSCSILVLKSALQQCGKNIITDFIGDKVLGPHFHFAISDLGKILGKFNNPLQGRKLITLNETGMSSDDWHRLNLCLKDLITTGKVDIYRTKKP
ncbi:hypothetical protein RhiirA5_378966 [Rhizophagus irregularis]|uniref:NrS-1 polymerase-like helicase domain-containing protein n=1 Tax=Rhizophagus irregularis TaxID=588596 RepID=A0A2N0PDV0_9GLOM|nr:hypothetical protein RhiirA5_378966 [Rhizophagus irregularis]